MLQPGINAVGGYQPWSRHRCLTRPFRLSATPLCVCARARFDLIADGGEEVGGREEVDVEEEQQAQPLRRQQLLPQRQR